MPHTQVRSARCAALVGPYLSGKTTLLESLLYATGAVTRKGSVRDGNAVGDCSPEAKERGMSTEVSLAQFDYLDEHWFVLDCPGSVELAHETRAALMACDVAVVVAEPSPDKAVLLSPVFKFLDDHDIPHILFVNRIDTLGDARVSDVIQAFQAVSERKLVMRAMPFGEDGKVAGYVDLVSERAWKYIPGQASEMIALPDSARDPENEARQELLEAVADFDDALLEKLLEEVNPETQEVYEKLASELADDLIVPVFIGSAEHDNGIRRLLKALRHESPSVEETAGRKSLPDDAVVAQVFKTFNAAAAGKLSFARVWRGSVSDGMTLGGERISGLYRMMGYDQKKVSSAEAGDVVALGRLNTAATGDVLTDAANHGKTEEWPEVSPPVYGLALTAENRNDEVKLSAAIQKLMEEDPSLFFEAGGETGGMILRGQGDVHLQIAMARLRSKYNVAVTGKVPAIPYKETIRTSTDVHARFKRQSGGHGQFADDWFSFFVLFRVGPVSFSLFTA